MTDPSLNVPHGYRLPMETDLLELAARLREAMEPVRDRIEIGQVAEFAAKAVDAADLAGLPRPEAVIFDAVQAQANHVTQILSGEHSCDLNTVTIAVTDDPETDHLYALALPRHPEFSRALDDMELGEYYPYWNEVETGHSRPKGVSAIEWDRRAVIWSRVLRGSSPFTPTGMFKIDVCSPQPDADLINRARDVFEAIPTREQRVHHAIHELQKGKEFTSHAEVMAFVASLPEHEERIQAKLRPISLEDIAGGAR